MRWIPVAGGMRGRATAGRAERAAVGRLLGRERPDRVRLRDRPAIEMRDRGGARVLNHCDAGARAADQPEPVVRLSLSERRRAADHGSLALSRGEAPVPPAADDGR